MPCGKKKKTKNPKPKQKQYGRKFNKDLKKNESQLSSQEDCYYVISVLQKRDHAVYTHRWILPFGLSLGTLRCNVRQSKDVGSTVSKANREEPKAVCYHLAVTVPQERSHTGLCFPH